MYINMKNDDKVQFFKRNEIKKINSHKLDLIINLYYFIKFCIHFLIKFEINLNLFTENSWYAFIICLNLIPSNLYSFRSCSNKLIFFVILTPFKHLFSLFNSFKLELLKNPNQWLVVHIFGISWLDFWIKFVEVDKLFPSHNSM